jgi:RNA polymerase sigma-70 factor (ECF subfamily)
MTDNLLQTDQRSRRFRDAALPLLDDAYRFARFLLRNPADAEDVVQECYLRALRHFDSFHGPALKPWLLAILRNLCCTEFNRRKRYGTHRDFSAIEDADVELLWQEPQSSPETDLLRQQDGATILQNVHALPRIFREAIVLREFEGLSYREISQVTHVPIGTVMSRLARARAMLRANLATSGFAPQRAKKTKFAPRLSATA